MYLVSAMLNAKCQVSVVWAPFPCRRTVSVCLAQTKCKAGRFAYLAIFVALISSVQSLLHYLFSDLYPSEIIYCDTPSDARERNLPCVGIEDWVVCIARKRFTFQPGRPTKHRASPKRDGRHLAGLQNALEIPDEFLVDIVQGPVF